MSVDPVQIQLLSNGTSTPADTDYTAYAELMGGGGYKIFKRSFLQTRTALATLWDAAIASAISGLASTSYVTSAIATALAGFITVSAPSRSLNSTFSPSSTKGTLGLYFIDINCTASLAGGQKGRVEFRTDGSSPPTTVRGSIVNGNTVALAIALTVTNDQRLLLVGWCKPGENVNLTTVNVTGTPTFNLANSFEIQFG